MSRVLIVESCDALIALPVFLPFGRNSVTHGMLTLLLRVVTEDIRTICEDMFF